MVRILLVIALVFGGVYLLGCGKKAEPVDEYQEAMSMEELTPAAGTSVATQEAKAAAPAVQAAPAAAPSALEPLPPAGPYKPTAAEIQTALKNAGFYIGEVDGKLGPMSEKAVKDFQSANGLEPDGKVGPKTWSLLGKHLKQ